MRRLYKISDCAFECDYYYFIITAAGDWHEGSIDPLQLGFVGWLVGGLTSHQHASVSQGRICSDDFTCCHTEIEVADQIFYLTQSQYTDIGPTSPSADPITPGAWQGSPTGVPMFKSLV